MSEKKKDGFWIGYLTSVANAQAKLQAYKDGLDSKPETDELTREGVVGIVVAVALIVISVFIIWKVVF